ncbi:MAG: cell envelope integrity protein TolA [Gammaproteobacteria bacterium]
MLSILRNHPRALMLAVLVHVVFIGLLVVSFHFSEPPTPSPGKQEIVHAVTVDESKVQAELNKLKAESRRKREREERRVREQKEAAKKAREARQREQQRLAELKRQREAEQKRVAEEQKKRQAEQQRLAKAKAEQQRLAKAKAEEAKRLAALKAQREKEEQQRKAAQEKKRREAEAARQKAEAQKALKQKLEAEAKRMAAEQKAQEQAERKAALNKYTALIQNAIRQHWQAPPSAKAGMSCVLKLHLIPGGEVVKIELVTGSGDSAVDQSVITAVRAASPLPVPTPQSGSFDQFRNFNLEFRIDREDLKQQG